MKRAIKTLIASVAIASLSLSLASAQEPITQPRAGVQNRGADAGRLDSRTRGANIRISQLMGYNIQNSQGESLGEIQDIVMDSRTGSVNYVAVTYGGFLGLGNKLFAVPFDAFKVQVDPDKVGEAGIDASDYVLILDVTQKQLEGQQGFDEDNWPNMADRKWRADLDKRYGVQRNMDANDRLRRASDRSNDSR